MLEKSSNSVKVVFADKNKVLHQLADYTRKVKRSRPEVEKVGLFGSYATEAFGPASDVDLLIILRESSKRFLDRIPDYLPENLSVSCDVFPYTKEEIERMNQAGRPWICHVLKEVLWL
ncbi:MAG: nucleotidyltransferase domain-containing protein [Planctomycetota bacterium]